MTALPLYISYFGVISIILLSLLNRSPSVLISSYLSISYLSTNMLSIELLPSELLILRPYEI